MAAFSRKRIFGYEFVAFSSLAIAVVGFLVWGHHMFVSSQSVYAAMAFSLLSFVVAIPSAIKVFNWSATLYKGSISFDSPMVYVFGFIGLFLIGGLTGLFLAALAVDVHVHDTYFVVAHFHYIMVGGTIMMYLGGLHYWWPKIFGKTVPRGHGAGVGRRDLHRLQPDVLPAVHRGLPRDAAPLPRVPARVPAVEHPVERRRGRSSPSATRCPRSTCSTPWSRARRRPANPWGAKGLEWETSSPPPTHNFDTHAGGRPSRLQLREVRTS